MIDPLSVLVAAALFAVGWLTGRHARLKAVPAPVLPICTCGDAYGYHDPETGACNQATVVDFYSAAKGRHQKELPCGCLRYTGPQPVEQYWVAPAADMSIVTAPVVREPRELP